ncbi:hypothetical protein [Nocardia mangyaensis]|uniref:hypothetical protein n=1 Tax=Nocardia mangyaensis TaxID=2213200 RepID=UPI0026751B65|nr:hypothetical protein [Nocardia mangyaensis]MDO3650852.1 hypothetical protein [Nocardia mangyaensis]
MIREQYGDLLNAIAIPALGCELGGLEWEQVAPLIRQSLDPLLNDLDLRIFRIFPPVESRPRGAIEALSTG